MRNIKLYWVLLMSVMLSACIAHGAKFVPMPGAAGQAVVYVYRESGVIGHGLDLEIFANRESIARLKVGTYEALHLAPGRYAFTAAAHKTASVVLSGIKDVNAGARENFVDYWYKTSDPESFVMSRRLIREEGLLCGGSCGRRRWRTRTSCH